MKAMYIVKLASHGNPDFRQDPSRSLSGVRKMTKKVATLREASEACLTYIRENDLGFGNWAGGQVLKDGKVFARISYNGRAFKQDGEHLVFTEALSLDQ